MYMWRDSPPQDLNLIVDLIFLLAGGCNQSSRPMGSLGTIKSGEVSGYSVGVTFEVRCQPGLVGSKLTMVGDTEALGRWKLEAALQLRANTGHVEGRADDAALACGFSCM
jgi:hypothetical protein